MITARTFIHLAHIQRDMQDESGEDAYGHPLPPEWETHLEALPCRYFYVPKGGGSRREIVDGSKTAVIVDARVIVPLAADITEADRILEITANDAEAIVIVDKTLAIDAIARRKDHLELLVREVRNG